MKSAFGMVGKALAFCAIIYALGLVRNPAMGPDLRPAVRCIGEYISGLFPEQKVSTAVADNQAERVLLLVHDLPQTPRY